jgi:tetratricopeptide (TPR) repeat protein
VRSPRPLALAWLAAAVGLAPGCGRHPAETWRDAPIVLVSIDTLRADHLPLYGYAKGSTPNLDALGREGVVFDEVYSHCPLTLPAHASMLTGLLPPHHGVRDNAGFALKPGTETLAFRLRRSGWTTGAAVSAFVLRSATGIAQGFEQYDDALVQDASLEDVGEQQRDGAVAVESLLRWIDAQGGRRFFAFLHLYEPHTPYAPPSPYRERFAGSLYDGEVAYADDLVGRFLSRLRSQRILDRAIVAVTSDHGEGLGDHGEQEHGFFLYRETVHVPLVLRLPGRARAGTRVGAIAAQVDLPATLLDLAGLSTDGMDGVSLRSAIAGRAVAGRPVYSETFFPRYHFGWSELLSVTEERYRYVRAPRPELFDVRIDPGEARNVAGERRAAVASMDGWLEKEVRVGDAAAPAPVDPQTLERLRALGYLGGEDEAPAAGGSLADPKDKIAVFEGFKRGVALRRAGKDAEAVAELRTVVKDSPGMRDAWETLGLTLARGGHEREGIQALERAVQLDPARASAHLALARVHALAGRPDLVEKHAAAAALTEPGDGYEMLAELMLGRNRLAEAAEDARKSLAADPRRVMAHFVLGVIARRSGRCDEALAEYRHAAEAQGRQKGLVVRDLHSGMADCLARSGREAEAEREFRAEIEAIPYSSEGRTGLAMLYRSQGRDQEARDVLEGVVTAHPRAGADEYWTVVRTLSVLGDAVAAREWAGRARSRFPRDPRFRG